MAKDKRHLSGTRPDHGNHHSVGGGPAKVGPCPPGSRITRISTMAVTRRQAESRALAAALDNARRAARAVPGVTWSVYSNGIMHRYLYEDEIMSREALRYEDNAPATYRRGGGTKTTKALPN